MIRQKILYIITKSNWGGAQRHVFDLTTSLPKDKFEVFVASGGNGELFNRLEEAGINYFSLGKLERDVKTSKELISLGSIITLIKKIKPDILHLHSPKAGGIGSLAGRLSGVKKIIYTNHGWPFNEPRPFIQRLFIKLFSWFTIILCSKVIVLSEREYKNVSCWPFVKKKLVIIPNGIGELNLLERKDAREVISKLTGIDIENSFIIGSIAELHRNKGLIHAIRGLPDFENIKYVIFGDGEEKQKLLNEITRLKLSKKVYLLGHNNKAPKLMKAFDAFVLPSLKEGMPYVILEAGFAGVPVIASRVGSIPDLIDNFKEGFLISPMRPSEIRHSVTYLFDKKEEIPSITASFRKKIEQKYKLDGEVSKVLELYKK